jgi:hypothetical protein
MQYNPIIVYTLAVVLAIISFTVLFRKRKKIEQSFANKYRLKSEHKIKRELETEATAKNLTFPHQLKDDVISKLANRVSSDIMDVPTPKVYSVQRINDRVDDVDVYLGGHILAIPFSEAEILAHKMTELSKNPQYRRKRKWLYLFWIR